MEKTMTNVIFAGVGGQGVILSSKILLEVAQKVGYDVKESEVHGMAQRGGSVDCHVRYGSQVFSPLIARGQADYIVGLEQLEGLRKLEYLKPSGKLIINLKRINPSTVETGAMDYPDDIQGWVKHHVTNYLTVQTEPILKDLGAAKALNVVMLGVLSSFLEFKLEHWQSAIRSLVKEKFITLNLDAFMRGRELSQTEAKTTQ